MEVLLHYAWKHKLFPLKELSTTTGQRIEVIDTGLYNRDEGPDFFNAKIKIGGTLWVGNVEIHQRTSDWFRHGHDKNPAYDSVILHVAEDVDCELVRQNGETIPQLQFSCPTQVKEHYEELKMTDNYPRCHRIIRTLPSLTAHSWMSALQTERLEEKATRITALWEKCERNWEDTLFITLARNFGFGTNSDAFEYWGIHVPLRATAKYRDDLFKLEAIFFGQAGLLEEEICDDYYQRMQKEYEYTAHAFGLQRMERMQWKFLRMRPDNFPHIRIAQLAWIYYRQQGLLSKVIEAATMQQIRQLFKAQTSEYWETHYAFGAASPKRTKSLSRATQDLIIINTVAPVLFAYGKHNGNETLCQRAIDLLEGLKAENNYITRMWSDCGLNVKNAADSQALIQLKKEYCDKRKCLHCRFGYEFLKQK